MMLIRTKYASYVGLVAMAAFVAMAMVVPAHAVDGVLEINQACADNTGCFAGDTAGFPVTITAPGSYILTGNLDVDDNTTGILISLTGEQSNVTLNLNGFTIHGGGSGTGFGVDGAGTSGVIVMNGIIVRFAQGGVRLDQECQVKMVNVRNVGNAANGIEVGDECLVTQSLVENGDKGILAGKNAIITDNIVNSSVTDGIAAGPQCIIVRNVVEFASRFGINAGEGCKVANNNVRDGDQAGIKLSSRSVAFDNVVRDSGDGIGVFGNENHVFNNTVTNNTNGINLSQFSKANNNLVVGKGNSGKGIRVNQGSFVFDNHVVKHSQGIVADGTTLSHIKDNTLVDNTTQITGATEETDNICISGAATTAC